MREPFLVPGLTSICDVDSGLALAYPHLASPLQPWEARARPGRLLPAARLPPPVCGVILGLHLHLASARTYPPAQAVSGPCLGLSLGMWYCVVFLEYLSSLLGLISLQLSNLDGSAMAPWVGNLMGKTPQWLWGSCPRRLTRCSLKADHITVVSTDWSC